MQEERYTTKRNSLWLACVNMLALSSLTAVIMLCLCHWLAFFIFLLESLGFWLLLRMIVLVQAMKDEAMRKPKP